MEMGARRRHPGKGRRWIMKRYWKAVGKKYYVFMDTLALRKMIARMLGDVLP
jgi:hypothetical protein